MKLLSNITINELTRSISGSFLSSFWTYWLPSHSLLWLRLPFLFLHGDFLLCLWLFFLLPRAGFLLWLWLRLPFLLLHNEIHWNEYPKMSFSKFLKYGENEESHAFTIDNTNGIKKKRSQFLKGTWQKEQLQVTTCLNNNPLKCRANLITSRVVILPL